jgi:RNA polymerase sigma-70 factor (ECF subfamily)
MVGFYGTIEEWGVTLQPALVNGQPGFRTVAPDGRLVNVVSLDIEGGAIKRLHSVLNPDKLGHLGPVSDLGLRPNVRATPRP